MLHRWVPLAVPSLDPMEIHVVTFISDLNSSTTFLSINFAALYPWEKNSNSELLFNQC